MSGVAAITSGNTAKLLAFGELIADKMPNIPDRTDPGPLLGRVAAGALVGAIAGGRTRRNRGESAMIGGLVAFASARTTLRMRRALSARLPALAAAVVEDAIVVGIAATGAAMLRAIGSRPGIAT
jgi:uncharacterized membrane protein